MQKDIKTFIRVILGVGLAGLIVFTSWQTIHDYYGLKQRGSEFLCRALFRDFSPDAVILTASLDPLSSLLYFQGCEKFRPDVTVISRNRWHSKEYLNSVFRKQRGREEHVLATFRALNKKQGQLPIKNLPDIYWEGLDSTIPAHIELEQDLVLLKVKFKKSAGDRHQNNISQLKRSEILLENAGEYADYLGKKVVANLWYNISLLHIKKGMRNMAEYSMLKTLAFDRYHEKAMSNLAAFQAERGEVQRGEKLLTEALSRYPGNSDLHFNYGIILEMKGSYSRAVKHLRLSVELNPSEPLRASTCADLMLREEDFDGAEKVLRKSFEKNLASCALFMKLKNLLHSQNRLDEVEEVKREHRGQFDQFHSCQITTLPESSSL